MPSRVDPVPPGTDSSSSNLPVAAKHAVDAASRSRTKRTRFTSGGGTVDNVSTMEEGAVHRTRRSSQSTNSTSSGSSSGRHGKLPQRTLPSSPLSPHGSCPSSDHTHRKTPSLLDTLVSQGDIPGINRTDHLEDENSFSSSVFPDHLTSSDIPLAIGSAQEDSLKLQRASILPQDEDTEPDDADSDVTKKFKSDMEGLLIHGDSEVSTPAVPNTDDAASSEGEDEKDTVLMPTADELAGSQLQEQNVASTDSSSLLPSCMPAECKFAVDGLSVLNPKQYECMPSNRSVDARDSEISFRQPLESTNNRHSPCTPTCSQRKTSPCVPPDALPSSPSRMTTRSQTAAASRHEFLQPSQSDQKTCITERHVSSNPTFSITDRSPSSFKFGRESPSVAGPTTVPTSPPPIHGAHSISCDVSPLSTSADLNADSDSTFHNQTSTILKANTARLQKAHSFPKATCTSSPYPLRSRIRRDLLRRELQAAQRAPKSFAQLPAEVLFRIAHYLSIQEVFRLQLLNRRMKVIVERYLLLVKRINFSNGLPFAFLPESINDASLKRILSRTPEVTHILGFYPKYIAGSIPAGYETTDGSRRRQCLSSNALTYAGIIAAFRVCTRLRSVELMDVELMGRLVHALPRIKFHGMFRNRPDSWDCEYAVPLPEEPSDPAKQSHPDLYELARKQSGQNTTNPPSVSFLTLVRRLGTLFSEVSAIAVILGNGPKSRLEKFFNAFDFNRIRTRLAPHPGPTTSTSFGSPSKNSTQSALAEKLVAEVQSQVSKLSSYSDWFDPIAEAPVGQGSPSAVPHILPPASTDSILNPRQEGSWEALRNLIMNPFIQGNLPSIEADLIDEMPRPSNTTTSSPNQRPYANDNPAPALAIMYSAFFVSPHVFSLGMPSPMLLVPPGLVPDSLILSTHVANLDRPHIPIPLAQQNAQPPLAIGPRQNPAPPAVQERPPVPARRARRHEMQPFLPEGPPSADFVTRYPTFVVSPLPRFLAWISLPQTISNLTKLDLVSVSISNLPRLDNIKYLHLKWVLFTAPDPFASFSGNKLQSFVMNNCHGPLRPVRYVRIFSALARALQLTRLELVGVPFIDGLLSHIIDVPLIPVRGFRNLQRLVLASNKEASEVDVGLLLLTGQQSLNHVAVQPCHARNTLFESLNCAKAKFPRLEYMILGYQDPYQSRLTISDLASLGTYESSDQLLPVCSINDRAMSLIFHMCPRLTYLTVRHAPHLSSIAHWHNPSLGGGQPIPAHDSGTNDAQSSLALRSLTLENCPALHVETLETAISSGTPFAYLETLVLRDMFHPRHGCAPSLTPRKTWTEHLSQLTGLSDSPVVQDPLEGIDWRQLGQLMAFSDFLAQNRIGFSSLCPDSIGLGSSVRDVVAPTGQFNLFYSLRLHNYVNNLLELDGSCGPHSLGRRRILTALLSGPTLGNVSETPSTPEHNTTAELVSQSTQTCVCGLLEWELSARCAATTYPTPSAERDSPTTSDDPQACKQLGGPLVFHPYPIAAQHKELYSVIMESAWSRAMKAALANVQMPHTRRVYARPDPCPGCSSDPPHGSAERDPISEQHAEVDIFRTTRKWIARDASIDTSNLRCHVACDPLVFTVFQPPGALHSNLTSIHFEKVGITHMVLSGVPHLKNLTLENCPQLQALLFHSTDTGSGSLLLPDVCPCLRRIRIIRCPRLAIYHLLHTVASLYPAHEENISIIYRPFGQYDQQVERALWSQAQYAHVLISHDYKQHESERTMEEFHSTFDQLFREVINFAEMLVRRDLLCVHPKPYFSCLSEKPSGFRRSEHGTGWDVVTDIPWIHEVCCSILRNGDSRLSDQADQFYEILSEIQSAPFQFKIQRRGIHFHVQYRDVHNDIVASKIPGSKNLPYYNHPYSEQYLVSTHPSNDINALGDRLNESVFASLPPLVVGHNHPRDTSNLLVWQRLLLAQQFTGGANPNTMMKHSSCKRRRGSPCPSDSAAKHSRLGLGKTGGYCPKPPRYSAPVGVSISSSRKRLSNTLTSHSNSSTSSNSSKRLRTSHRD